LNNIPDFGHISINNKSIYYEFQNRQYFDLKTPILVFLHEGLGSSEQWKAFPASISDALKMPVLMYDRYGYAKSEEINVPRKPNFLEFEAKECLFQLFSSLHLQDLKKILIGHSDGGSIALLYASFYPDQVKAVISEAHHLFLDEVSMSGLKSAYDAYHTGNLHDKLKKYHAKKTAKMFNSWINFWLDDKNKNWNIEHHIKNIICPVLAIQGTEDNYGTAQQLYSIKENSQGETQIMLIENCGHIPHHEAREIVEKEIIKFLSKM
jgi:pimeloyl-ACP methyl ester carboxylesterase